MEPHPAASIPVDDECAALPVEPGAHSQEPAVRSPQSGARIAIGPAPLSTCVHVCPCVHCTDRTIPHAPHSRVPLWLLSHNERGR